MKLNRKEELEVSYHLLPEGQDDGGLFEYSDHPHILLKGVRFCKRFISKDDLVANIESFFEEEGYPLCEERRVGIVFKRSKAFFENNGDKIPYMGLHNLVKEYDLGFSWGDIVIFPRNIDDLEVFMGTLFHELAHVLQEFMRLEGNYYCEPGTLAYEEYAEKKAKEWCGRVFIGK